MRVRGLGRTGISVSELTIGTATLAAGRDPVEASAALALALERGINAIEIDAGDRATVGLLRAALAREGARNRVHVLARVPTLVPFDLPSPHVPAQQAYPGRHIRVETEALLRTLGVERLALQQLHGWCPEWLDEGDWRETLERLRDEGKIAGFGISLFDHDVDAGLEAVASGAIDSVEVMYNLFDQGAAAALLPLCRQHAVAAIVRSPLYFGALAPSPGGGMRTFPREDWRRAYFFDAHRQETEARTRELAGRVQLPDRSLPDLALRFSLSHPAISTVAVGMHTRPQVEANVQAIRHAPLDAEKHASLAEHGWLCSRSHGAGLA